MVARLETLFLTGLQASPIQVEADISFGLPSFSIVGLAATSLLESRERVRSAIRNSRYSFPTHRITVNLAPAYLRKDAPHIDLSIAMAILMASDVVQNDGVKRLYCAELSLDGSLQPVAGLLALLEEAERFQYSEVIIPEQQRNEASLFSSKQVKVRIAKNLRAVVSHLQGILVLPVTPAIAVLPFEDCVAYETDLADITEQNTAKRALEIAAAGGHHILMQGSPGIGKTMLARALPSILPPLSPYQQREVRKIYSVSNEKQEVILSSFSPFRAPHHTISDTVLLGGGAHPRPGEISLAHHGVLFLDELLEFSRSTLEALRQPLESHQIVLRRPVTTVSFPTQFLLIGAYNPCPCGYFGDTRRSCVCTTLQIANYQKKLSGPLLDRIDIHIKLQAKTTGDQNRKAPESSSMVRQRVIAARLIQAKRYKDESFYLNGHISAEKIKTHITLEPTTRQILEQAVERYGLSHRAMHKIMRIARTIADLSKSSDVKDIHIAEASQYRLI